MSKVILTQEQADAVEYFRETFVKNKKTSMSNKTLARALNDGYEVEPEFKVSDWVWYDLDGSVGMIVEIGDNYIKYDVGYSATKDHFRHATPEEIAEEKERRWWAKHGRGTNEYRVGDVIIDCDGYFGLIDELPKEFPNQKRNDDESDKNNYYVKLDPDWQPCDYQTRHVEDLKLVCFVENRLDVKDDE